MSVGDRGKRALEYVRDLAIKEVAFFEKASLSADRWSVILRAVPIIAGIFSAILSVLAGSVKSVPPESNVNLTITFGVLAAVLTALTSASASVLSGFKIGNWFKVRTEGLAISKNILCKAELALETVEDDKKAVAIANRLLDELGRLRLNQQREMAATMSDPDSTPRALPSPQPEEVKPAENKVDEHVAEEKADEKPDDEPTGG